MWWVKCGQFSNIYSGSTKWNENRSGQINTLYPKDIIKICVTAEAHTHTYIKLKKRYKKESGMEGISMVSYLEWERKCSIARFNDKHRQYRVVQAKH